MKITSKLPFKLTKKAHPFVFLIVGVLLFFILLKIPIFARIQNSVQSYTTSVGTFTGNTWSRIFSSKKGVHAELNHYKDLSASLAIDNAYVSQLEDENSELYKLLSYSTTTAQKTITARIVARAPIGNNSILIDKGSDAGLKENMPIVIQESHMIGSVWKVNSHTAVVKLLSNQTSSIPVTILGKTKTLGLVEGQDGFLMTMNFIPQNEKINIGDVVVTSGLDGNTPSNLVVGTIYEVIKNETNPFQQALIEPLTDLRRINHILILSEVSEL